MQGLVTTTGTVHNVRNSNLCVCVSLSVYMCVHWETRGCTLRLGKKNGHLMCAVPLTSCIEGSCGSWITPAFKINRAKVDVLPIHNPAIYTARVGVARAAATTAAAAGSGGGGGDSGAASTRRPVATRPVASRLVATRPVASRLVATRPVASRPVATRPVASRPVASQPTTAKPSAPSGAVVDADT